MSGKNSQGDIDLSIFDKEIPEIPDDGIIFKYVKPKEEPAEVEPVSPLEDKNGRDLWIRTRMCFCDVNSHTDCRFHSTGEPGWEQCPNLAIAKKGKLLGRWLWARNPMFGKPVVDEIVVEVA